MDNLAELLEKAKEAVRRDLNHIFIEVSQAKLSPASARDLVNYTKLLTDVLDMEKGIEDELASLSEAQLKSLASKG